MSNKLKRNYIQLFEGENEKGEPQFETYLTPHFIPSKVWYECIDMMAEMEEMEEKREAARKRAEETGDTSELVGSGKMMRDQMEQMMDVVVNIYGKQFTKKDLKEKLHAPNMIEDLQEQIQFIATGQQDAATKKFVESRA